MDFQHGNNYVFLWWDDVTLQWCFTVFVRVSSSIRTCLSLILRKKNVPSNNSRARRRASRGSVRSCLFYMQVKQFFLNRVFHTGRPPPPTPPGKAGRKRERNTAHTHTHTPVGPKLFLGLRPLAALRCTRVPVINPHKDASSPCAATIYA